MYIRIHLHSRTEELDGNGGGHGGSGGGSAGAACISKAPLLAMSNLTGLQMTLWRFSSARESSRS